MSDRPTVDEKTVARQILSYFLRTPEAVDSLEGIARWRLLEERVHESVRMTEAALRLLVEMQLIVAERTETAGTLYHLNENKRVDAERFASAKPASTRNGKRRRNRRGDKRQ